MQQRRPVMLAILDGWGWREEAADNAVRQARTRRARIKALLLDQSALRGVGNIYADESLFRAGIRPRPQHHLRLPARRHRPGRHR